jgi:hypothetical protein
MVKRSVRGATETHVRRLSCDDGQRATYDVTSHGDGSASVRMQTRTMLGEGAPGRHDGATLEFDSLEQALV